MELEPHVLEYIARATVRRYGPLSADLAAKMRRNVRRNFQISVPSNQLAGLMQHYKTMYSHAAEDLKHYIKPASGPYASWDDVQMSAYTKNLQRRFKKQPPLAIQTIANYAVYYEYLR